MPDYEKMYHKMMTETDRAIQILIQAQRDCEELYLAAEEENQAEPKEGTGKVEG